VANSDSVLLVANYASNVGYAWWLMENFWVEVAEAAHSKGRRTFLAYPKIDLVPPTVSNAPITLVEQTVRPVGMCTVISGIKLIREHRVRSIYLTDWPAFSPLYAIWRLAGVRSIVMHDHTPGDRPRIGGLRGRFKAIAHRVGWFSCDSYVGVSDYIRQRLIDNWRVPPERALVVRNGIQPFSCRSTERSRIRSELGIPTDAVMVALVSRATYYKGWDFAVRCAAEIVRKHPRTNTRMVFCGDGNDLQAFRSLAIECGVAGLVHFLGRRDDVRSIICSADIAFHPSHGEAMSLATLEFMCAGLPVVVPDRPSVCGIIDSGLTGLTYRANDVSAAADAIVSLCFDRDLRATLGRNARAAMLERYQLTDTNDQFQKIVVPLLV